MKKYSILFALFFCAILQSLAQNQIAIYVVGDASESYKKVVASALTQCVNSDGNFQAVERTSDFIGALGNEVTYQNSGAVSQSRITELGKQFGAQYVLVVDLNNVLGELYASSRIINVERNVILASSDASSKVSNMEQLRALSKQISTSTLNKLPANIAKKKQQENDQKLRSQISKFDQYPVSDTGSLHLSYRNNYTTHLPDVEEYIRNCEELGVKVNYPIYYDVEYLGSSDYDKKKNLVLERYKTKYIIKTGQSSSQSSASFTENGSITWSIIVNVNTGHSINNGETLRRPGYHLCRSSNYKRAR